jgi:hypothetical protein
VETPPPILFPAGLSIEFPNGGLPQEPFTLNLFSYTLVGYILYIYGLFWFRVILIPPKSGPNLSVIS